MSSPTLNQWLKFLGRDWARPETVVPEKAFVLDRDRLQFLLEAPGLVLALREAARRSPTLRGQTRSIRKFDLEMFRTALGLPPKAIRRDQFGVMLEDLGEFYLWSDTPNDGQTGEFDPSKYELRRIGGDRPWKGKALIAAAQVIPNYVEYGQRRIQWLLDHPDRIPADWLDYDGLIVAPGTVWYDWDDGRLAYPCLATKPDVRLEAMWHEGMCATVSYVLIERSAPVRS